MKLIVLAGAKQGTEIPLKREKFVIGRASDCTLRAGSEAISRHHCAITRVDGGLTVRDLGSRNGTYVNGEKIDGETSLNHGDEIRVGTLEFRLDAAQDINRTKKPKVKDVADAVSRAATTPPDAESSGVFEDDISRWLLGPSPDTSAATRETQSFRMDETHTVAAIPPLPVDGQSPEAAEGSEEAAEGDLGEELDEEKAKAKGKRTFGKLPPIPKKQSKDSREAAADILREMARRR
ncbi:FHA domain-containing protein [Aeoliella mucimassa]|uniref:Transcriptional regulatory protein EmbR n=1 Tax=Aeoliella mucimassa TaxID=2527972 RepID=A0A518AIP5_9BACT|nr:FHA domain-containing protein [Aeoliella mucimassa]QDU54608.1 Transcriptional regulatory protein EmbR [Aeoliella mucimassa]